VNLGRSGLVVSRVCLGCMSFAELSRPRHACTLDDVQSGPDGACCTGGSDQFFHTVNEHVDGTSEEILGPWIKRLASRDEVVIATNAFWPWWKAPNTGAPSVVAC
jgi:aryl-alcohol dehydrogenase-like predicted oxidoreductase